MMQHMQRRTRFDVGDDHGTCALRTCGGEGLLTHNITINHIMAFKHPFFHVFRIAVDADVGNLLLTQQPCQTAPTATKPADDDVIVRLDAVFSNIRELERLQQPLAAGKAINHFIGVLNEEWREKHGNDDCRQYPLRDFGIEQAVTDFQAQQYQAEFPSRRQRQCRSDRIARRTAEPVRQRCDNGKFCQ